MADISTIVETDRTIEILHPGKQQPLGIRVTLIAVSDDRMTKIKRDIANERIRLEQRGKGFKAEDLEENKKILCRKAMLGWEWYNPTGKEGDEGFDANEQATFEGETPDFNERNIKRVFEKLGWFVDQVFAEMGDTESFFGK